jgi:LPPG:FO 2-phospho-L-lactate transferase
MSENFYLALSGGVGGAKLALGLSKVLSPSELVIVANTADDFVHLGQHISPDLDTIMYTLAGLANPKTGWGLKGETWGFMDSLERLGGDTWFRLGDKDLATHIKRTSRLREGAKLSEVTKELCSSLGVDHTILPMSNDPVRTKVATPDGELDFQHYFVRDQCAPTVTGFRFEGLQKAIPTFEFTEALTSEKLKGVIICPSNPFVSVDPILSLPAIRKLLPHTNVPIIAVSPIVGGAALKGPAAKMMQELGMPTTVSGIANYYSGLIDGLIIDTADQVSRAEIEVLNMAVHVTKTVMTSLEDRIALAKESISFAKSLSS